MNDLERARKLFNEGLQLLEEGNFEAAETKLAQSLEIIPDAVSVLNNLSAVKILLNKFAEAEAFTLKAVGLDAKSPGAWFNLGIARAATNRPEEALQAYDQALNSQAAYPAAWLNKAMTLHGLKRPDEALMACDQGLKGNPGDHKILYAKSLILKDLKRLDEARKTYFRSLHMRIAASPVFKAQRQATQKADVLIISQNPIINAATEAFDTFETLCLNCSNYPSQLAGLLAENFHFTFVFEGQVRAATRQQIPQPNLVLNNHANGELVLATDNLSGFIETVDSFGVPVVNHPTKVIQSTREASAKLLAGIPGVVVPKIMRFSAVEKTPEAMVREIEDQFDYPLITRTLFCQEGKGMTKVDSREALVETLSTGLPKNFFVTEFVDSRGKNKFFRKIRASIVNREIIINRVDCDTQWNVHTRKSDELVAFYLKNSYLLDEEKQLCGNPEAWLGKPALQALQMICDRIPLDIFGVDFDVDAGGRLIFYEANATMLLFNLVKQEVQSPQEQEDSLKLMFQRYFTSLVMRRKP